MTITNKNISVCTTAIPRPDIHEITYSSFSKNIIGINLKEIDLYLNMDIPKDDRSQECIKVAQKHFKNVHYNISKEPNFSNAIKWCWESANTDFILHLEDDWELLSKINISDISNKFKGNTQYSQIILRAWTIRCGGFSLSPSFIKREAYKSIYPILDPNQNPEEQIRNIRTLSRDKKLKELTDINTAMHVYPDEVIVKDLGRKWMQENNLNRSKKNFIRHNIGEQKDFLLDQNREIRS